MNNIIIICSEKIINENYAASSRILNYAKAFADEGKKVYFSSLTINNISKNNIVEYYENIYCIESQNKTKNIFLKFISSISYLKSAIYMIKIAKLAQNLEGKSCFILYPSNNTTMEICSILIIKCLYKNKLYCEINELRKTNIYFSSSIKNNIKKIIRYILYKINEYFVRYFDGLIAISTNLENYYKKYNSNILRIPILTDIKINKIKPKQKYSKDQKFIISFTGWINIKKEGFDTFYEALGILQNSFSNFEFHLYGDITKEHKLILDKVAIKNNIKNNIFYFGIIPQRDILEKLEKSHLLVIPRPNNKQAHFGFSTKLSEYLISGTPILITNVSDNAIYIKDGYNGFILDDINAMCFAEKLLFIINNYNDFISFLPLNAYKTAEANFYYQNYSKILIDFLGN